jgi:hypothetical protein
MRADNIQVPYYDGLFQLNKPEDCKWGEVGKYIPGNVSHVLQVSRI